MFKPPPMTTNERYRVVFEMSPLPMWIFDPQSFRLLDVNAASVGQYGYSRDELLSKTALDLRPPEGVPVFLEYMRRLTEEGGVISARASHRRKDGSSFDVEVTTHDVFLEGKRVRLAVFVDVSKKVEFERQQEAAKRAAEEADKAKTFFLANMSHEIRTPLGAITGFCELLEDPTLSAADRAHHIRTIRRNADMLTKVVNEILDITKIENMTIELENVVVDLPGLIEDVLAPLHLKAMEKGILLEAPAEQFRFPAVCSDPTRLKQVMLNLVSNAVKFTERGHVRLSLDQTPVREGVRTTVRVADTGVGISPDHRDRLFKPFSQADASMSRRYGGTGLGLSIAKEIAGLLGGGVRLISSAPDQGSIFEFDFVSRLPAEARASVPLPMRPTLDLAGLKVLVVDDAEDNRELLKLYLARAGAEVDLAANGAEGVSRALSDTFDAILMDIQMPVLDGYEAMGKLRQSYYHGPIVALTAHALKSERDRALTQGFDAYMTKPINRAELIRTLRELQP